MVHHRISSSTRFSTAFKLDAGLCLDIYICVCFLYNDDLTYFDLIATLNTTFGKNLCCRVLLFASRFCACSSRETDHGYDPRFYALKKSRASLLILSFSCVSLSLSLARRCGVTNRAHY